MKKLQGGNTQILILVLIVVLGFSAFLYFKNSFFKSSTDTQTTDKQSLSADRLVPPQAPEFKTYTNSKYGFSIQYPETLAVREFPDTGDGAGFRPSDQPEDPQYEVITVSVLQKNADMADDSLADYAKVAATIQIQNYEKLNSIDEVKTGLGLTGYKTTWMVAQMPVLGATSSGALTVSQPITYFDLPKAPTPSTLQVSLSDENYVSDYEAMLKTFSE